MQVPFLRVEQRWIWFMSNQADISEAKTQIIIIIIVVIVGGRYKVMAGNSPEMKRQKKKKKTIVKAKIRICVCYMCKYYSGKTKQRQRSLRGAASAPSVCQKFRSMIVCFFCPLSFILKLVSECDVNRLLLPAPSSTEHFLLGYIEIMVLWCQCETHVFFNKGHIYIYIYLYIYL